MTRALAIVLLGLLVAAAAATASDIDLPGSVGHPRARLPLAVYLAPLAEAKLQAAVRRAVDDWNAVFRDALGPSAFTWVERDADAQVVVTIEPAASPKLMGETSLRFDPKGTITPPVSITLVEPRARGQTASETLLYQVVAHELGHAVGLGHTKDPRSIMCCVKDSLDFNDAAVRQAYVDARRHPDLRSVEAQLKAHYASFWSER